jgi:hypothetical protein
LYGGMRSEPSLECLADDRCTIGGLPVADLEEWESGKDNMIGCMKWVMYGIWANYIRGVPFVVLLLVLHIGTRWDMILVRER